MEYHRPPSLWEMLRGTLLWVALLAGLLLFATAPTEPQRRERADSPAYAHASRALADGTQVGPRTKSRCVRGLELAAMDSSETVFTLWVLECVKPRLGDSLRATAKPPVRMH